MIFRICQAGMLEGEYCMQNGSLCVGSSCPFDFYEYEEIAKNCLNCVYLEDVDGGSAEFAIPIYICSENQGYGNLLSFPFKKDMDCFKGYKNYI